MATNQNEYNQALQNLILMNRKKIEIEKVWENASPTSAFAVQDVSLDLNDYDFVRIRFNVSTTSTSYTMGLCAVDGTNALVSSLYNTLYVLGGNRIGNCYRYVTVNKTKITFSNGLSKDSVDTNPITRTNMMIPVEIYGVKEVK